MNPVAFTHAWREVPFFSDALEQLPIHVTLIEAAPPPEAPWASAQPAQVMFAHSAISYNAALFEQLPNLRMVQRTGIGVDNINLEDATRHGIVVCNTPDGPTESTAEHTVAMLLNLAKRVKQGNAALAEGRFGPRSGVLIGVEVTGKVLGLVGLGRIGRRVARICRHGLDMEVLAYDPFITPEQATALGVTLASLEEVLQRADFVSLHAPVTPETYRLINRERIATMKPSAFLLNLARGPLVDAEALLEAVDAGKLAGAGIDVFDPEPPELDSRLRDHPLIIATPHSATLTVEGRIRIEQLAVERVLAFFRGERPPDMVNPAVWDSPTRRA